MIYVVGDLHGDLSKIKKLHEDKKLSKSDTVILLGDTGLSSAYEMFATSLKKQLKHMKSNTKKWLKFGSPHFSKFRPLFNLL